MLALGRGLDATSIAEALWLAAVTSVDGAANGSPARANTGTSVVPDDDIPAAERPGAPSGMRVRGRRVAPGAEPLAKGRQVRVEYSGALPQQLELVRSLKPFKRLWREGRRLQLDVEATVRSYARTWQLVPEFRPAPERWFETCLVIDDSLSMAVWEEAVTGLSAVLGQLGAFRSIRTWRMSLAETGPVLHNKGGQPSGADQLRDPGGRRLIIIISDGSAAGWFRPEIWQTIRKWAASTPTVLVSPLPARLWRRTGLDLPTVRTRTAAPGSPSALLRYSLPYLLREPDRVGQRVRDWLPVPAVMLSSHGLGQWAGALMRTDPRGCDALLIPSAGRPDARRPASDLPSDQEVTAAFLRMASPEAARLAVLCAPFAAVSLPLLRLICQALVPTASTGDLAEVIVSGLFLPPVETEDGAVLRFRDGARDALAELLSESDAWHVYDTLRQHITHHSNQTAAFAAVVHDPPGDDAPPVDLAPLEAASRGALEFLGVLPGSTSPTAPEQSLPAADTEIDALALGAPDRGQAPPIVTGDIPQQPAGFQSRAKLLATLDRARPRVSVVHSVSGMAGVGKTQLAAAYARDKLAAGWRLVAWINAQDSESLLAGLIDVAAAAGLPEGGPGADAVAAGLAVRHWLEADGDRCLIVFDNASDPDALRQFLPAGGRARILITSTRRSMADQGVSVAVDVFATDESEAFLANRTGLTDPAGAAELAGELGNLPLALDQAAAVIAAQRLSYQEYLERLRRLQTTVLLGAPEDPYPRVVAETVLLSLEAVRTDDRAELPIAIIEVMSVLSSAGVSRELLLAGAFADGSLGTAEPATENAYLLDDALGRLADRSLLTFSVDGGTVFQHRLIMRVVRDQLARQGRLNAVGQRAASLLNARARALVGSPDRQAVRDIPEQVTALLDSTAGFAGNADDEFTRTLLEARLWALYYLNELAESPLHAIAIGEPLTADLERVLGPDHPDTLTSRNNLANAYRAAGRITETIPVYERTLAGSQRMLGPDHLDTLRSLVNLAVAYQEAGRLSEAIPLYERAVLGLEQVVGPDHPSTLAARNNLGGAYQEAGRFGEAIPLHERTLADRERVFGPDHPDTLTSRNNLANAYQAAGRITEAIPLYERNLAGSERVLGPDHPDTLVSRNNLANTYLEAGRAAEAIPLHERTLADRERVLGPDHPDTLTSRNNLANAYQAAGRITEAIPLYERNLAGSERVLGPDHPGTLVSRNNLANAYREAGRARDAIELHEQALTAFEQVLGPDHPDTLTSRNNLAAARHDLGQTN